MVIGGRILKDCSIRRDMGTACLSPEIAAIGILCHYCPVRLLWRADKYRIEYGF
jgi:hypothetical protein